MAGFISRFIDIYANFLKSSLIHCLLDNGEKSFISSYVWRMIDGNEQSLIISDHFAFSIPIAEFIGATNVIPRKPCNDSSKTIYPQTLTVLFGSIW